MAEVSQSGWTRIRTPHGRYEYQFQGRMPAVRGGKYEDAADYQFLVMDEEGWLFKIPVRISVGAELFLKASTQKAESKPPGDPVLLAAEAQLRAGLEIYRPKANAPYAELDEQFAIEAARARELARGNTRG
ncbi:MAG: hypothetical protein WAM91_04570 [Candidatus Acidiferrales bacterium]